LKATAANPLFHAGQTSSYAERAKPLSHAAHSHAGWVEPAPDPRKDSKFRSNTESRDNYRAPAPAIYQQNNRAVNQHLSPTKLPTLGVHQQY
jgi:hypothetical protein